MKYIPHSEISPYRISRICQPEKAIGHGIFGGDRPVITVALSVRRDFRYPAPVDRNRLPEESA
jgi:hypothetical protein